MMRSFYILILVFSGIVSMLKAQNEKRDCFDMRVGYSNVTTKSDYFYDLVNTVGPHGSTVYPEYSISSKKNHNSGFYINSTYTIRQNTFFEIQLGLSYTQFKTSLHYYDKAQYSKGNSTMFYNRDITTANGDFKINVYRSEISPVIRIFNTKIILVPPNLEFLSANTVVSGSKTNYDVILKQSSNYYYSWAPDSIVTALKSESFERKISYVSPISMYFGAGLEQEIPYKNIRFLVGSKFTYSPRSYANYYIFCWLGIRFSKPYTWKQN